MRKSLSFVTTVVVFFALITTSAQSQNPYHSRKLGPANGSLIPNSANNGNPGPNSTGNSLTGANIDVLYHKIFWRISPDSAVKYIKGSVQTNFKTIVANVSTITFDLNAVHTVDSVRFRGAKLAGVTHSGNIVTIPLGVTLANNFIDSLTIYYRGIPPAVNVPPGAVGYQKASDAGAGNYIYTLSESYEDRDWWPCKADMQDKIDSIDITVSVPWASPTAADTFWVACNGKLVDSTISGNSRFFTFKSRYPIASYLVAVCVARFDKVYRTLNVSGTTVPVVYNVFRGMGSNSGMLAKLDSQNLAVVAFSNKLGDYPFKKEKHGFYAFGFGGGMEHQTFSGIDGASLSNSTLLAHELMHQWFGDNVTFATWNDLWLAEGFAAYGELDLFHEFVALHPVTAFQARTNKKATALSETVSAWMPDATASSSSMWNSAYGSSVYDRGCMVVSMLRSIAGDNKFFQTLTNYQTNLHGSSATTDTLRNYFNASLGMNIGAFFTDYVGGSGPSVSAVGGVGNPINVVNWNTPAAIPNRLVIQMGTQSKSVTNNVAYFRGPVVVHFTNAPSGWTKDTTITLFDWGNGKLSYAGNGISDSIPGPLNFDLSFTPTNAFYDDSARTMSTGSAPKLTTIPEYIWNGGTNSTWATTTNWVGGIVPPAGEQVTIATTVNQPIVPGSISLGGLFVTAGSKLNIGNNTLTINGPVSGTGTITGSTSSNIIMTNRASGKLNFDQGSSSTRALNNLTISNGSNIVLGSALDIYGTLSVANAILDLNAKNLTLKSSATNTARIDDLTGSSLAGATNVTVERYIPNDGRRYRLLAPTVNTSGSIKANWMEGGMNTVTGTNIDLVPGFGTQITGLLGNVNGFDVSQSNSPSLYFTTNGSVLSYNAVNTTTSTLNAGTGYFLFVRGDRTADMTLNNTNVPPTPVPLPSGSTILRTTGTLVTGTQNTFSPALVGSNGFSLIANPYASPIDWSLLQPACTGITNFYTLWDPNNGYRGGFVTVNTAGVASAGLATKFIQGGQAFFVQASGAPIPTVSIQESQKSAGNNNGVFGNTPNPESFSSSLYYTQGDGKRRLTDGAMVIFDNGFSASIDGNDADEISNWDENIAIDRLGHHLSIEGRPVIGASDSLPLFISNMKQMQYEWEFKGNNISNPDLKGELIDNFSGTRSPVSVYGNTVIPFDVTNDPLSAANNRFLVVFSQQAQLPITFISIKAYQKSLRAGATGQGIAVEWVMQGEMDMNDYEVEKSADGINFSRTANISAQGNSGLALNYAWIDANPFVGNNYYRIKASQRSGRVKYSSIVIVVISKLADGISIYPNPFKGSKLGLQLTNLQRGNYSISLTNKAGQIVYTESFDHTGGSVVHNLTLKNNLPAGSYDLQVNGMGVRVEGKVVKE